MVDLPLRSVLMFWIILFVTTIFIDETDSTTVDINKNISGFIFSNGTSIKCVYTNVDEIERVRIEAYLNSSLSTVVTYNPYNGNTDIALPFIFLEGRVRVNGITQADTKVVMTFENLLCVDQNIYRCRVTYLDRNSNSFSVHSEETRLEVKVLPSGPEIITYFKISEPETTIFTSHTTLAIPSDSNFTTATNIVNNDNTKNDLKTGDNITISCFGNVGSPPGQIYVEKRRNDGSVLRLTAKPNSTIERTENCSVVQNREFTDQLNAEDNVAVFRCFVQSPLSDSKSYIETYPIDVKYPVQKPTVKYIQPDTNSYRLYCMSNGNPEPDYQWYRTFENDTSHSEAYASVQNTTFLNITQSEIFTCRVNNTVDGKSYIEEENITLTYQDPRSTPSTPDSDTTKNETDIITIIVPLAVSVLVVIAIICICCVCCRYKSKKKQNGDETASSRDNLTANQYTSVSDNGYYQVELKETSGKPLISPTTGSSPGDVKKHNEKYLKEQEEEDKTKETASKDVYAVVNKTAKPNEEVKQSDSNEEDHYAESPEGLYDHTHDPRHIKPSETETYDTTQKRASQGSAKVAKTESGKEKHDVGSYEDIKKIAVVGPTTRPTSGQKPANYENTKTDNQDNVMNQSHITIM